VDELPPTYLKLHMEEPPELSCPPLEEATGVEQLCGAFERATGWSLKYVAPSVTKNRRDTWTHDIAGEEDPSAGRLVLQEIDRSAQSSSRAELESVQSLAACIGELLGELHRTRQTAWRQSAELATAIPVAGHPDEQQHLAGRLQAVLKGGAEAVGCQAAALYLLDDATTQLTLRSAWGLPAERLPDSSRPLNGATADLQALSGHAVVLEETDLLPHWRCPEPFASAVCVPVSSPTMPFGTLWMFCSQPRDFSDRETNLVEIIAGRLAADLEREVLLREGTSAKKTELQLGAAAQQQRDQLPQIAPNLDGWQVAGYTEQADEVGGGFHDWFVLRDGNVAAAAGTALGEPLAAAMTTATLSAGLKAHAEYRHNPQQMIQRVGETLWESGAGDRFASLVYAVAEPESGKVDVAGTGSVAGLILRSDGYEKIQFGDELLGHDPEPACRAERHVLSADEVLVLVTDGVLHHSKRQSPARALDALGKALQKHRQEPAERIVSCARQFVKKRSTSAQPKDQTILVLRRY
jgi:serine phosphatase RsbU (regulator of sigma subunit)